MDIFQNHDKSKIIPKVRRCGQPLFGVASIIVTSRKAPLTCNCVSLSRWSMLPLHQVSNGVFPQVAAGRSDERKFVHSSQEQRYENGFFSSIVLAVSVPVPRLMGAAMNLIVANAAGLSAHNR